MSERLSSRHEHHEAHHAEKRPERPEKAQEAEPKSYEAHKKPKDIETIRRQAEQAATSAEQTLKAKEESQRHAPQEAFVNKELKEMAYQRLLIRARRALPAYQRGFSHIVHQPVVNAVSETLGRTVARPSGILGAGTLAFAGGSAYYFIAKHYGYAYNFFVFLLLLLAGMVAGWLAELLWRLVIRPK